MCKEDLFFRLEQEGLREGGGNCLKYLKTRWRWNRKEGRRNKDFKNEVAAGSRDGCLKKGA